MNQNTKFRIQIEDGQVQKVTPANTELAVAFSSPRQKILDEMDTGIRADLAQYPKALRAYDMLIKDPEALGHWDMSNYITMRKLGYNDHGRVHAWMTGAASLAILELLLQGGVKPDFVESGFGDVDDANLIVILGTMLHDIGNEVHREQHEQYGVILAMPILDRILPEIYEDVYKRTKVRGFILHCINCHDIHPAPLTIEGGITAVADGTDITKGRGRKAYMLGSVDIHSLSALAVDEVKIVKGRETPVEIRAIYNNPAGIFQLEEVLAPKVIRTPLSKYVTITAVHSNTEDKLLRRVRLNGAQFVLETDES